ncbi:MAG: sulfur carrier protein ThiS [Bacillota bacterium]
MIKVNNRDMEWFEGMTVQALLDKCKYTYPSLVVSINGKVVLKEKYPSTMINDGDDVKVIHMMAGG